MYLDETDEIRERWELRHMQFFLSRLKTAKIPTVESMIIKMNPFAAIITLLCYWDIVLADISSYEINQINAMANICKGWNFNLTSSTACLNSRVQCRFTTVPAQTVTSLWVSLIGGGRVDLTMHTAQGSKLVVHFFQSTVADVDLFIDKLNSTDSQLQHLRHPNANIDLAIVQSQCFVMFISSQEVQLVLIAFA